MNTTEEVSYRLALSAGFLVEAEQDLSLGRWRSCVDNAQLTVENSGKAVLALFNIPAKTHDPARQIAVMLQEEELPIEIQQAILQMLPDLLIFGKREHFLTDYGDEATYTLPWDLFDQGSAEKAITSARTSLKRAQAVDKLVSQLRKSTVDLS